jgi:hypothetical protein
LADSASTERPVSPLARMAPEVTPKAAAMRAEVS